MEFISVLTRWIHIVAGVMWIGHLYFFNFVNAQFAPTMDGETKKKVVPELVPRALYFFRWGAAWTWVSGLLLLMLVFYHGGIMFADPAAGWNLPAILSVAFVFVGPVLYDVLYKGPLKDPKVGFVVGVIVSAAYVFFMAYVADLSFRAYTIHLGALFGTTMAFNVWMRIWPAQQQIIRATKDGTPADAALVGLAGTRSKHNTYMSVPLIYTMMNSHATFAANPITVALVVLVGWGGAYWLYQTSKSVKGF